MTAIPLILAVICTWFAAAIPAQAQDQGAPQNASASAPAAAQAPEDDPDLDINFAQPDFTLVALPTTLRLPRHKSAFRVSHRFGRPLGQGDFGDLVGDLFGLDGGALIGLEYRFGVFRGAQFVFHRTSNRTIQFMGQYDVKSQRDGFPVGIAAFATAEGTNNFRDSYSPGVGVVISRELGEHGAVYVTPTFVHNVSPLPSELVDDNDGAFIGLGARLRVRPTVYLVLEGAPRIGIDGGASQVMFGFEKRWGGHSFQMNFGNHFGTTMAEVARGGGSYDDWFIGFGISRKFF